MPVVIDEVEVEAAPQARDADAGARPPAPVPRPLTRHDLREMMRRETSRRVRLEAD